MHLQAYTNGNLADSPYADSRSAERKHTFNSRIVTTIVLVIFLALFSVAAYCRLFSTYSLYDDEGYFMMSLHQYLQGRALYDEVPSGYGPFYYLFHRVLHGALGVPITHDAIRWVFLGMWLFVTFACFRVVLHVTRSRMAALIGCIPFFWMLGGLAAEPAHPQGLVLVLIGLMLLLPTFVSLDGPWRSSLFAIMGVGIASLILVKPNIGGFLLLSLLWTMLAMAPNSRWTQATRYALAFACLVLPPMLMFSHLKEPWAQKYALLTMATLAPILILLTRTFHRIEVRGKDGAWLAISMSATAVAILAATILKGSTLQGLIFALVLLPMKFASIYFDPLVISRESLYRAVFSLLLFAVYVLAERFKIEFLVRHRNFGNFAERTLRVPFDALLMGFFSLATMYYFYTSGYMAVWNRLSPFLWISLISCKSLTNATSDRYFLRVFLIMTAAFQILHAYPVAGSQTAWSMIWLVPVAMVCLSDAWHALPDSVFVFRPTLARMRKAVATALVLAAIVVTLNRTWAAVEYYSAREPLNLPGAARLRTDSLSAETYRWLVYNLRTHSDTFIGLPGLNSLYFWTGKEPPTAFTVGAWMTFLDNDRQTAVAAALSRYPNVAIIRHRWLAEGYAKGRSLDDRPLVAYINQNFRTIGSFGGFEFLVRNEREEIQLQESVSRR